VLSNLTTITLVCGPNDTVHPTPFSDTGTLYSLRLTCACRIIALSGLSVLDSACREHDIELTDCNPYTFTITPLLHSVNLAVMQHFYDMTNASIWGRDLFNPNNVDDQPAVDWPLFSDNASGVLVRDKEAGYDLAKLVKSL